MKTKVEYHLCFRKKTSKGSHHSTVTRIRADLDRLMAEYRELVAWGERVPDMELIIDSLTKRTYTEEAIPLPQA